MFALSHSYLVHVHVRKPDELDRFPVEEEIVQSLRVVRGDRHVDAAVADVFDALSTKRHYKEAFDPERCFQMIESESGSHFDPDCVDAFLGHVATGTIPADPASTAQPSRARRSSINR